MKPWYKSKPVALILVLAAVVLLFGWRPFANALGMGTKVYVSCAAGAVAVSCTVEHKSGFEPANACWDVAFTCANGVTPTAHACQAVDPDHTVQRVVQLSEFSPPAASCSQVVSSAVNNVVVTAR